MNSTANKMTAEVLRVWPDLSERIKASSRAGTGGWLTGFKTQEKTILLHFSGSSGSDQYDRLQRLLPPGVSICGAWARKGEEQDALERLKKMAAAAQAKGAASFVGAVLTGDSIQWYCGNAQSFSEITPDALANAEQWLGTNVCVLRCSLPLHAEVFGLSAVSGQAVPKSKAVDAAVDSLRQQLTGTMLFSRGSKSLGLQSLQGGVDTCGSLGGTLGKPIEVQLLRQRHPQCDNGSSGAAGPSFQYQPVKGGSLSVQLVKLSLDVLMLAPGSLAAASLEAKVVRPAIKAQLEHFRDALCQDDEPLCDQRALHFQPPGWPHPLTVIYPLRADGAGKSLEAIEEQLLPMRKELHQLLGLPMDRPMLRMAKAMSFDDASGEVSGAQRLRDVHQGLPASGVQNGSVHMVEGSYDYHHYMQDKFDDSGWGCAYRSLQTICSWMQRQQYTSAPVPTHRQIQQTLVDIGDKPSSFVGSKQWIGAIELGFILDTLLGVSSKVITVSNGAEMASKAREIAHHFDSQGTPIMMGGGVLAYTLLGIDYNERTGQCAFLILDPHYTGSDDLKAIHKGQWVAWKKADGKAAAGGDLFVKNAFYNLLCPQRPRTV